MKRKKIFSVLRIAIIVYCLIGILLHAFQDKLLFHPKPLSTDYPFSFNGKFDEYFLPVNKTDTLHLLHFKTAAQQKKGNVIYFHGNRNNSGYYLNRMPLFLNAGYDVWMPDYPSFGKSRGMLNDENIYLFATQTYKFVTARTSSEQLIIYGRSLGTAPASYTAIGSHAKRLILETPYSSIPSLFKRYAFIYPVSLMCDHHFSNRDNLLQVRIPVTIFHGTRDEVIPFREAAQLKKVLKEGDRFVDIENGRHNNINSFDTYLIEMNSILR